MTDLILLRHAKSDWRLDVPDFDRPLKKRGRRDAKRMGKWLHEQGIVPDIVLSSPARRAMQTAEIFAKAAGLVIHAIKPEKGIYDANLTTLTRLVAKVQKKSGCILMVGHNPGLDMLLLTLARGPLPLTDQGKLMTTATLAHLRLLDADPLHAELIQLVRPADLKPSLV